MVDVSKTKMAELPSLVGQEIGVTEWVTVTQEMVTKYAEATRELDWMHIDVERCRKESPYGGTIVQGFLPISLIVEWINELKFTASDLDHALIYGTDRARITSVMLTGCRLRGRFTLASVSPRGDGQLIKMHCVVEMEDAEKPAAVVDWLTYWIPKQEAHA